MAGEMAGWWDGVIYPVIFTVCIYSQTIRGMAKWPNGGMVKWRNGYLPTTFTVHANDDTDTF